MKTEIYEFDEFPLSDRNGSYGGQAGEKEGILIYGEYWIVKYPKSTRDFTGKNLASYSTAPLSEYIGSHIYQILGIDVHETELGVRNEKLVVACKDFCKTEGALRELRNLKNTYNKELAQQLETSMSSTETDSHCVPLEDMMIHLQYNPILKGIPDIQERFWQQFLVDMFINNNDRNNGNWGLLYEDGALRLAPVFDNGASFMNKTAESKFLEIWDNDNKVLEHVNSNVSVYTRKSHKIHCVDIITIEENGLYDTALKLIPIIQSKMSEIRAFIENIPTEYKNYTICSRERGQFYLRSMELKLEKYFLPILDKAKELQKNVTHNSNKNGDYTDFN